MLGKFAKIIRGFTAINLPPQKLHLPFLEGYSVNPRFKLVKDNILDFDENLAEYCEKKKLAEMHSCHLHTDAMNAASDFLLEEMKKETGVFSFSCHTYKEWLSNKFVDADREFRTDVPGNLSLNIQEDIAIIQKYDEERELEIQKEIKENNWQAYKRTPNTSNWIAMMHVAQPSGWDVKGAVGKSFKEIHSVVPHMEEINENEMKYVDLMVNATKPMERFLWSVSPSKYYVERQCVIGFPDVDAALFTIRPYFYEIFEIADYAEEMIEAIESMSYETLLYKNIERNKEDIISILMLCGDLE